MTDRKQHWEHVYATKRLDEVSWFEPTPQVSLDYVAQFNIAKDGKIIDIGGGDSFFVDNLLDRGYTDITVLDISENAINRAKERLKERADRVKWIVADASEFSPVEMYDFWHDRAAFHFLTNENDIRSYLNIVSKHIKPDGVFVIGTFSEKGPKKCSGIDIKQYTETELSDILKHYFDKVECKEVAHTTPFNTTQSFLFCSFKHK